MGLGLKAFGLGASLNPWQTSGHFYFSLSFLLTSILSKVATPTPCLLSQRRLLLRSQKNTRHLISTPLYRKQHLAKMSYVKSFSARYGDESAIYEQLTKIFPMVIGIIVIVSKHFPSDSRLNTH